MDDRKKTIRKLKKLFKRLNLLIKHENFEQINIMSRRMKNDQFMLSFLRFTFSYRQHIPEWNDLLERAEKRMSPTTLRGLRK